MNVPADKRSAPYRTHAVRDLAWACFSPPLLDCDRLPQTALDLGNCALPLTGARLDWLAALDRQPAPLLTHLAESASPRLGLYFEHLWQFFLIQDPEVELVAHNLPVRQAGQTVGEFDCIYYCHRRQRHVHLELAVKFYLQQADTDGSDWADWVGPNQQDRLDRKLQRLLAHQLRLVDQPAARVVLERLGIAGLDRELEVKGRLFHRAGDPRILPPGCRGATESAWHCTLEALPSRLEASGRYQLLDRTKWLAPVISGAAEPLGHGALLSLLNERVSETRRPQLVVALDHNSAECERFFVTPDDWGISG